MRAFSTCKGLIETSFNFIQSPLAILCRTIAISRILSIPLPTLEFPKETTGCLTIKCIK